MNFLKKIASSIVFTGLLTSCTSGELINQSMTKTLNYERLYLSDIIFKEGRGYRKLGDTKTIESLLTIKNSMSCDILVEYKLDLENSIYKIKNKEKKEGVFSYLKEIYPKINSDNLDALLNRSYLCLNKKEIALGKGIFDLGSKAIIYGVGLRNIEGVIKIVINGSGLNIK